MSRAHAAAASGNDRSERWVLDAGDDVEAELTIPADARRERRFEIACALAVRCPETQGAWHVMSVPAIPPILVVAPALLAIASAQNMKMTVKSLADSGAKSAAASTTSTAGPVIRLDGGALDFGVNRPVAASGSWVTDWVAGPIPVATNAWQLTIW